MSNDGVGTFITVPLAVIAELHHGCLATVRLSNDGWEEGDNHAARRALEMVPDWLRNRIEAFENRPQSAR